MTEWGGGLKEFRRIIIKEDPLWVETAYLTIVRKRQMDELRMISEDEWPSPAELEVYESHFQEDINYYTDERDYISELGMWLRDKRIRQRKEQVRQKKEQARNRVINEVG